MIRRIDRYRNNPYTGGKSRDGRRDGKMADEKELMEEDVMQETEQSADGPASQMHTEEGEAVGSDAEASEKEAQAADEDKKAAKKKAKADKKQEALKEKIDELEDRVKRQMAEFENFRRRTDKEKQAMFETGAKSVIEKILPVVDNFERGLDVAEDKEDPFVQGMEKIYKQFITALNDMGVKAIEAVGNEFNPDFHNAVMHVEDETVGENIVVEEFQKGYMYKESVVRHSMVKVAN